MKIHDVHCHVGYTSRMSRVGDADNLLDIQKRCGFESVCVQTIVLWEPKNILRNLLAVMLKAENPSYFHIFGGIVFPPPGDPKPDLVSQAEQLISAGFDGIKLFGKPTARSVYDLPFTHDSYRELYSFCLERDVPILFHVGDPSNFWSPKYCPQSARDNGWYYGGENFPSLEQLYEEVESFMRDFPKLRILFPHMLFMSDDLSRLNDMLERYPNMRTDITPGTEMYFNMNLRRKEAREFFIKNAGRILFGTDNGGLASALEGNTASCIGKVANMKRFLSTEDPFIWGNTGVAGLGLPEAALNALYYQGFEDFLGKRRTLDAEKVFQLCRWWKGEAIKGGAENFEDFDQVIMRIENALA